MVEEVYYSANKIRESGKHFVGMTGIRQNGLRNKLIQYVEIEGQKFVVRGNGRLQVAEDLGITDQLTFEKVDLPFPPGGNGYRSPADVIEESLNIIYNRPRRVQ